MVKFNKKSTRRSKKGKDKKRGTYESAYIFYEDPWLTFNAFKNGICTIKATQGKEFKPLTLKNVSKITNNSCTSKSW